MESPSVIPDRGGLRRRTLLVGGLLVPAMTASATVAAAEPLVGDRRALTSLARKLHGPLLVPGQAGYRSASRLWSPRFDRRTPAAVAGVVDVHDVATLLTHAGANGLRVTARSGGHSYVGASAADGTIVADLRRLATISYDAATGYAHVGAGANLYEVHRYLAAHGRTIPTGTCPTVGVGGLTSGGGLGPASRARGLTCDALVEAEIVLPSGRVVRAGRTQNTDLFWAVRGGGGGLVGVVTRWTFATHPATSQGSFVVDLPGHATERIIQGWAAWIQAAPRSQWANLHLTRVGGGLDVRVVGLSDVGHQRAAAAALLRECGVRPERARYAERDHLATVRFLGGGTTSPRQSFTAGSDVLSNLTASTARALHRAAGLARVGDHAVLDTLTGAVQDHAPAATAFPWRRHAAVVQWYAHHTDTAARQWVARAHQQVHAVSAGRYLNYVEPGTLLAPYLGANTARASRLREHHDPQQVLVTSIG